MCLKVSNMKNENEIDTVKALMSMILNAIISDVFQIDFEKVNLKQDLRKDLNMNMSQENLLKSMVSEYFNGYKLELPPKCTIQHLHNDLILHSFMNIC